MPPNLRHFWKKIRKKLPFAKASPPARPNYGGLAKRGLRVVPGLLRVQGEQLLVFEGPCKLNNMHMQLDTSFRLGAYSYLRGGIIKGLQSVGRYSSIGPYFVIGESEHPLTWASTSPAFYAPDHFNFHDDRDEHHFIYRSEENDPSFIRPKAVIGNDVWIGANVTIRRGVSIGDGAVIGAGSLVLADVEPYTIVVGTPARPIRNRFSDPGIIEALQAIRWWEFDAAAMAGLQIEDPAKLVDGLGEREARGEIGRRPPLLRRVFLRQAPTVGQRRKRPRQTKRQTKFR